MRFCGVSVAGGGPARVIVAALLFWLVVAGYSPAGTPESMPAERLFEQASPPIVSVVVTIDGARVKQGSGFLVSDDGLVATNYHVIEGGRSAEVVLPTRAKLTVLGVVASNRDWDIAILRVEGKSLPFLKIAKDAPKIGAKVYAIGNPKGLTNTLSDGLISGVREVDKNLSLLQTTAAISPGSSGGPLLAESGEVVGITTSSLVAGQNLNFAVPSKLLLSLMAKVGEPIPLAKASLPTTSSTPAGNGASGAGKTYASLAAFLDAIPKDLLPQRPVAQRPKVPKEPISPLDWSTLQVDLVSRWMKDTVGSEVTLTTVLQPSDYGPDALFVKGDKVIARFFEHVKPRDDLMVCFIVTAEFDLEKGKSLAQIKWGSKILVRGVVGVAWATRSSIVRFDVDKVTSVEKEIGRSNTPSLLLTLRGCDLVQEGNLQPSGTLRPASNPTIPVRSPEEQARVRLSLAKAYVDAGAEQKAIDVFKSVIAEFPETKAAVQAQREIERLVPVTSKKA